MMELVVFVWLAASVVRFVATVVLVSEARQDMEAVVNAHVGNGRRRLARWSVWSSWIKLVAAAAFLLAGMLLAVRQAVAVPWPPLWPWLLVIGAAALAADAVLLVGLIRSWKWQPPGQRRPSHLRTRRDD